MDVFNLLDAEDNCINIKAAKMALFFTLQISKSILNGNKQTNKQTLCWTSTKFKPLRKLYGIKWLSIDYNILRTGELDTWGCLNNPSAAKFKLFITWKMCTSAFMYMDCLMMTRHFLGIIERKA